MRACSVISDSFTIPRTVAHQAPLSVESSKQEYWSGLPFPLQGVFLTQGSDPGLLRLLHWQADPTKPVQATRDEAGLRSAPHGAPSAARNCGSPCWCSAVRAHARDLITPRNWNESVPTTYTSTLFQEAVMCSLEQKFASAYVSMEIPPTTPHAPARCMPHAIQPRSYPWWRRAHQGPIAQTKQSSVDPSL